MRSPAALVPCDHNAGDFCSGCLDPLLRDLVACPPGPGRSHLREEAIRLLLPLAQRVARRFRHRGEDMDDLIQVASLGLVKAVDGYDPTRGHAFLSYAVPTIVGELQRHLRDRTTVVRLPRPVQEARGQVFQAFEELEQRLRGRTPTSEQIAKHTGLDVKRVEATLRAVRECNTTSLDAEPDDGEGTSLAALLGRDDPALDRVVDTVALASAVRDLPERERHILHLRFFRDLTQLQIASAIGLSQMQVSRIIRSCVERLRQALSDHVPVHDQCRSQRRPAGRSRKPRLSHPTNVMVTPAEQAPTRRRRRSRNSVTSAAGRETHTMVLRPATRRRRSPHRLVSTSLDVVRTVRKHRRPGLRCHLRAPWAAMPWRMTYGTRRDVRLTSRERRVNVLARPPPEAARTGSKPPLGGVIRRRLVQGLTWLVEAHLELLNPLNASVAAYDLPARRSARLRCTRSVKGVSRLRGHGGVHAGGPPRSC
ncbi:SigB/SigF/SigG family RNA polymerase sigma factor [Streptomyces spinosus]|uniref:SigB/SigF/SigG family RNA polymerase sigma factor n=1 Tax=Streptomyces spinosus TaxID=2872623 RepID=UPI001CECDE0A|nr:SigB/SigF/SigG family RNA polymerase sigma factor [Streptomyces spinosus]